MYPSWKSKQHTTPRNAHARKANQPTNGGGAWCRSKPSGCRVRHRLEAIIGPVRFFPVLVSFPEVLIAMHLAETRDELELLARRTPWPRSENLQDICRTFAGHLQDICRTIGRK